MEKPLQREKFNTNPLALKSQQRSPRKASGRG